MAAGDIAATFTYGTNKGDQGWLVLGGGSSTGGDIYAPGISIGSDSTYLVHLSAHQPPVANLAPFGSISTGSVQTAQGQTISGSIYAFASQDIVSSGTMKSDFISLNSSHGNVGNIKSSIKSDASVIMFNSFAGTYLNSIGSSVDIHNSQSGVVALNSPGNINIVGTLTGGAIAITSKTLSIRNSVSAPGPDGFILISTNASIDDSIGLSKISSNTILLDSVAGNINIGTLTAPSAVILTARSNGAIISAANINTAFLGVISSNGAVVNTTTASGIVARSGGDVNITSTSAVNLGDVARLPSRGRNFTLTAPGIKVSGVLQADQNVLLDASSSTADFEINRNIVAGNAVDLRSGGSIYQTDSMINGATLTVSAVNDIGAPLKPLVTTASILNLPTAGRDVYIYNDNTTGSTTLTNGFTGRNFVFLEVGNLTVNGAIQVTGDAALAAVGGGSLFLNQSVSGNRVLLQASNTLPAINRISNGSIIQTAGTVSASSLYLRSGDGGIVSTMPGGMLQTGVAGTIDLKSTGAVGINNIGALTELIGRAAQFSITTNTDLALSDFVTTNGNLSVISSGGAMSVKDHSHVMAHHGNLTLRNLSPTGSIAIGSKDALLADLNTGATVEITVGPGPYVRTNSISPSPNIIPATTAGGQIFFGVNGIGASPPTNLVRAGGANSFVVFDGPVGSISLGGESIVSANHVAPISSLDLNDPSVVTEIRTQQNTGLIGGSLVLNAKGEAIGGSVIILQPDIYMDLFGLSVPQGVTLQLTNFISPINVDISSANYTDKVQVNGGLVFAGPVTQANTVNINNSKPNTTVLSMANTGFISAQGPLTITGNGSAIFNFLGSPALNVQMTGSLTFNGMIHAPGGTVTLTSGNNGNIALNNIFAPGGTVTVNAHGTGKISASGLLHTAELNLNSGSGDIGTKTNPVTALVGTLVNTNTTGAVFTRKITLPPPEVPGQQIATSSNIQPASFSFNFNVGNSSQISNNVLTVDGNLTAFGPAINVRNRDTADDSSSFGFAASDLIDTSRPFDNTQASIFIGSIPSVGGGYFFGQGSAVFAPNRDIDVKTAFGTVHISKGAIVLLVATSKAVSVYDLHDTRANDVYVSDGERQVPLSPGAHLLVTDRSTQTMGKVNPLRSIGHRRVNASANARTKEFSSEFSIASALAEVKSIAALRKSRNAQEQQLYLKLLKTAVALGQVASSRGAYERQGP
jgi:hypothetical protein